MLTATNCVYFDQKRRVVGQLNLTDTEIIFSSPSNKDIRISLSDVYGIQPSVPNSKHSFVSTSSLSIASSTFSMPTAESTAATSKKTHSTFSANRFKIGRNDLLRGSNFSLRNLEKMGDRISPENTTQYKWITIFALPGRVKGKQVVKKLKHKMWTFELTNSTPDLVEIDVINWIDAVRSLLFAEKQKSKRILVIINPYGGTKQGLPIYKKYVLPMFKIANIEPTIVLTEYPNHASEIAANMDLDKYDCAITISGDGLFNEFLNGLMHRPDWEKACKFPIGIIPGGSSNALGKNVDTIFPDVAALNIIKGYTRPFDLFAVRYINSPTKKTIFGFLEILWAIIADIDLESDKLRWAGPARFTMWAIVRLLNLRTYYGELYYLPADDKLNESKTTQKQKNLESPYLKYGNLTKETIPESWKHVSSRFTYFTLMNLAYMAADFKAAPKARLSDGTMDLITVENGTLGQMLRILLDTESGTYVKEKYVNEQKVHAIALFPGRTGKGETQNTSETIQSKNEAGCLDIDGERLDYEPILVECLPGIARLIVPLDFDENVFSI